MHQKQGEPIVIAEIASIIILRFVQ
uniref:Uncharacterized protein n=1 Tax=Anguilla anguilla TaxID=7936 RepID=A0A0E9SZF7_ANGAN